MGSVMRNKQCHLCLINNIFFMIIFITGVLESISEAERIVKVITFLSNYFDILILVRIITCSALSCNI